MAESTFVAAEGILHRSSPRGDHDLSALQEQRRFPRPARALSDCLARRDRDPVGHVRGIDPRDSRAGQARLEDPSRGRRPHRGPTSVSYVAAMHPSVASPAAAVLDHIGPGSRPDRAARQRRAGHAARRHRGRRRRPRRGARAPDARAARPAVPARRLRRPPRHVSYFLSARDPPVLPRGHDRPRPEQLQRDARRPARRTHDPLVLAAASPPDRHGYFSLGLNADYVASFIGRARFFLEANPRDAADVRPQPDPRQPGRRLDARPTTRSSRSRRRRSASSTERIAALVAERIPDGATHPGRHRRRSRTPSCRPSRDHRDLGIHTELISDGIDRPRRGAASSPASPSSSTAPRPSARSPSARSACYDFLDENTALRAVAGAATSTTRGSSPRSRLRVDQRHDRRRPPRPVRLRDGRRRATTPRAAARPTSPAARCTRAGGQGFVVLHSTAKDGTVSKIVPQLARRRRRHDAQEHRRQGGHRVGRRRAARSLDPRAGRARSSPSPTPTTAIGCGPRRQRCDTAEPYSLPVPDGGVAGPRSLRKLLDAVVAIGSDLDLTATLQRISRRRPTLVDAQLRRAGRARRSAQGRSVAVHHRRHRRRTAERAIGDLPKGHGILGLLIADPAPLRLPDLTRASRQLRLPAATTRR